MIQENKKENFIAAVVSEQQSFSIPEGVVLDGIDQISTVQTAT